MRQATMTALEIRDEAGIIRDLDRGELEARILQGERAQASAPPEVSSQLRLTAQAQADALRQARHDQAGASSAQTLARQLAAERQRLEVGNARYENWSAGTRAIREAAGKARSELARRGQARTEAEPQPQPQDQPQTTAGWWREFEADAEAAERAIARQHQGAICRA